MLLIFFNLLPVVVVHRHLEGKLLEYIVEHHFLEIVVHWDFELSHVATPTCAILVKVFILISAFLIATKFRYNRLRRQQQCACITIFSDINNELLKIFGGEESASKWIVLGARPNFDKAIDSVLSDWQVEGIVLACERVNDNGDEDVQEDLRYDNLEGHVIAESNCWISTSECIIYGSACLLPREEVLLFSALEQNASFTS